MTFIRAMFSDDVVERTLARINFFGAVGWVLVLWSLWTIVVAK